MGVIVVEMTAVYLAVHLEIVHNKMCLITSRKTVANIYRHKALALLPQRIDHFVAYWRNLIR